MIMFNVHCVCRSIMYLTANVDYRMQMIGPKILVQFSTYPIFTIFNKYFSRQKFQGIFPPFYLYIKISFLYNQCHLLSFQHYTLPVFQVVFYGQYYRPQRPNNRVLLQLDCLDKILNYSLKIILHTQCTTDAFYKWDRARSSAFNIGSSIMNFIKDHG